MTSVHLESFKKLKKEFQWQFLKYRGVFSRGICPLPVSLAPLPPEAPVCVHHGSAHRPGPASLLPTRGSPRSGRNLEQTVYNFSPEATAMSIRSSSVRLKLSLSLCLSVPDLNANLKIKASKSILRQCL